jgi:hypothetical protein
MDFVGTQTVCNPSRGRKKHADTDVFLHPYAAYRTLFQRAGIVTAL